MHPVLAQFPHRETGLGLLVFAIAHDLSSLLCFQRRQTQEMIGFDQFFKLFLVVLNSE